jgi:hypothetical protein
MIQVSGTYNKGSILLDERIDVDKPFKVIVTFMDENIDENKRLMLSDFSFAESQELLKHVKGNISDAVIEARRSECLHEPR